MTSPSILRGRVAIVLPAVVAALALSACGSSSSSSSSTGAGGASVSVSNRQQARLALAKCLRAQGLNVPDPGTGGVAGGGGIFRSLQNIPTAKLTAARQACKSQFTSAFPALNLSPAQRAQLQQQLVKFASCMRAHGINFPDPQLGAGGGPGFGRVFRSVDRNSPAFASAARACASFRPRFGPGGPGGPGGGPGG